MHVSGDGLPVASVGESVAVDAGGLLAAMANLFAAVGVPEDDARLAADVLVASELRGVKTHGVSNLGPRYLAWLQDGFLNPTPDLKVVRGRSALRNVDGDRGLGIVVAARVMEQNIEIARETGIAMTVVHNSRHLGMAAYHAMRCLEHGMIGVCTSAVRPRSVPTFGREPRLGTNPIAFAAPAGQQPPFVFDAATTTVAGNKLRIRADRGEEAPAAWMLNPDGTPRTEPAVPAEPFLLTPLGGTPEGSSYKGYGLAAIVDILGLVLSQASFGGQIDIGRAGHTLAAIDIESVIPLDDFTAAMDEWIAYLRSTPPAEGYDEVLVAGDPELRETERQLHDGIDLPESAVDWILRASEDLGCPTPLLAADSPIR